jgi:hypothetical protein
MLIAAVAIVSRRISGLSQACKMTEFHIVGENPPDKSTAVTSRKWQRYWSSELSWKVTSGGGAVVYCEIGGSGGRGTKLASDSRVGFITDSAAEIFGISLLFVLGMLSLGG